jgi:hypothetical protein
VLLDNCEQRLTPKHVLASAALIPDFPPQEIDGRVYCDGGFTANVPLHAVFGRPIEADTLCIAVDLFSRRAKPAWSIDGMAERRGDLTFANQTRSTIEALKAKYALLAELRAVAAELSAKRRQALQQAGRLPDGDAFSAALAVLDYSGRNEGMRRRSSTIPSTRSASVGPRAAPQPPSSWSGCARLPSRNPAASPWWNGSRRRAAVTRRPPAEEAAGQLAAAGAAAATGLGCCSEASLGCSGGGCSGSAAAGASGLVATGGSSRGRM